MSLRSLEERNQELLEKRGEGRRYALILAGLELFGEHGLEATTTRMLARRAGANIAAIPYYFGGKEGLYKAVVQHIAERVGAHMGTVSEDVGAFLREKPIDRNAAREGFHQLWRAMAHLFVDSDEPKSWTKVLMREKESPTEAYDILYNSQIGPMQQMAAELIAIYTGRNPNDEEIRFRVHALAGAILGFLFDRFSLLRALGTETLEKRHIPQILHVLGQFTETCLEMKLIDPSKKEL